MKYSEILKNMWQSVSSEESRYMLTAIHIDAEKKVAVATDGHLLTVIDIAALLEPEEKSFLIPVQAIKAARSLYMDERKRDRTVGKKNMRSIFIRSTGDAVTVFIGESRRGQSFEAEKGLFPDWERVAPEPSKHTASITLSVDFLSRLCASLQGNYDRDDAVSLLVKGKDDCVIVSVSSNTRTYGVLMPMRTEHEKPARFWSSTPAPPSSL